MKSWVQSKMQWFNGFVAIVSILVSYIGYLPPVWAGYIMAIVAVVNIILRFLTKGAISIALPSNVPTIPPILQAAIDEFEKAIATLPPDFGPRAFQLVDQAETGKFENGTARINYVLNALQTEFPGAGTNLVRGVIENLLLAKNQGVKPTLSMSL